MYNGSISIERWQSLHVYSQLANIGSEVGRVFKWKKQDERRRANFASSRVFELFDATINDPKNIYRKKEIIIAKKLFTDLFFDRGEYKETPEHLEQYFTDFAILARSQKR